MEDIHRTHKEKPFGRVVWAAEFVRRAGRRTPRRTPWSDPPQANPPGDLHHLAAPR